MKAERRRARLPHAAPDVRVDRNCPPSRRRVRDTFAVELPLAGVPRGFLFCDVRKTYCHSRQVPLDEFVLGAAELAGLDPVIYL